MKEWFRNRAKLIVTNWVLETGMADEVKEFISNPAWAREFTDAVEAQGKRWFWSGVGAGLFVASILWAIGVLWVG